MSFFPKLLLLLQERLPVSRRVYFIYTHKNGFNRFYNGLKANTEISYWCFSALQRRFPSVRFLRLQGEKKERIAKIRPQDVVIGHIGPTFELASQRTNRLIAFNPWAGSDDRSTNTKFNCVPKEWELSLYNRCASLILLTSEYNQREYLEQPRNFWYPYFQEFSRKKSVRVVHQPIDLTLFKRIKWEYTTSNFLYIGNNAHMKCVEDAVSLVESVGQKITLYGTGEQKINHLNADQIGRLPLQADFFIQPGMWEAQCVSILEAAARGFIPIVTPETGYPYTHPYLLRFGDFEYNRKVLNSLLKLSSQERLVLADSLYKQLVEDKEHNTWKALTDVLVDEVDKLLQPTTK